MPVYKLTFPLDAAGLDVEVVEQRVGTVTAVESDAINGPAGDLIYKVTLDDADYTGFAKNTAGVRLFSTDVVLDIPASIEAGGSGGGSVTDGVGAVFFGGEDLSVPINNIGVYSPFVASDDPPRAPQRDDLLVIDEEDDTTLNVVQSGLYDITLNTPLGLVGIAYEEGVQVEITADVQIEVNGGNEPPIYDFNNRAYWSVWATGQKFSPIAVNLTTSQVLLAGDTVQLRFKASQAGLGEVTGTMELAPDITAVFTYRGPVAE